MLGNTKAESTGMTHCAMGCQYATATAAKVTHHLGKPPNRGIRTVVGTKRIGSMLKA
tara:strand:- start:24 stop:194 length:171 start_codon:yes stop_codon:yes gene_type:complete